MSLYLTVRGWRGQVPRQPGQDRKVAATTSPTWVDVQPLTSSTRAFCAPPDDGGMFMGIVTLLPVVVR